MSEFHSKEIGILLKSSPTKFKVSWKDVLFSTTELAIHLLLLPLTAGGSLPSAVTSAKEIAAQFSFQDSIGARANFLIMLSMAMALDDVVPKLRSNSESPQVENLGKRLKEIVQDFFDQEDRYLEENFLENPGDTNLIESLINIISNELATTTQLENRSLNTKIRNSFNSSIFKVVELNKEYFLEIFSFFESPFFGAALHEWEWKRYRQFLIHQFEVQPVFGQEEAKIALSDLYVPLAGARKDRPKKSVSQRRAHEPSAAENDDDHNMHVEDLEIIVDDWIQKNDEKDPIRLIFGGPGSGKSTFTKYIASKLANEDSIRPIHIELQRLRQSKDLHADIERLLTREYDLFSSDPIHQKGNNVRYVIIFDGLDELVVPNSTAADRVAAEFAGSLVGLLREFNVVGTCRALALVTGRTQIAKAFNDSHELPDAALVNVQNYLSPKDLRPVWWARFAAATNLPKELPGAFSDSRFREITSEPLLCYLFALSGYLSDGWENAAANHNLIYEKLLEEVWVRRWGEQTIGGNRAGPSLALTKSEFSKLMETVAVAAWWGGEIKTATFDNFDQALSVTGARQAWDKFCSELAVEGRAGLSTLALTFYLAPDRLDGRGVEFTHKSFGEYLVGRFLLRHSLTHIAETLDSPRFSVEDGAKWWCQFAIFGLITREIKQFIENEARLLNIDQIKKITDQLSRILQFSIDYGLPVHRETDQSSFLNIQRKNRLGNLTLLACINAANQSINSKNNLSKKTILKWDKAPRTRLQFLQMLTANDHYRSMPPLSLSYIDFSARLVGDEDTVGEREFCSQLFFAGVDLSHTDFSNLNLSQANFNQANLQHARFFNSDLSDCQFTSTDLSGCDLRDADLSEAKFSLGHSPILSGAYIEGTTMPSDWLERVDPETFKTPPIGNPIFSLDDKKYPNLSPGDENYPDLAAIYAEKMTEDSQMQYKIRKSRIRRAK